jgi:hypothetical protein
MEHARVGAVKTIINNVAKNLSLTGIYVDEEKKHFFSVKSLQVQKKHYFCKMVRGWFIGES